MANLLELYEEYKDAMVAMDNNEFLLLVAELKAYLVAELKAELGKWLEIIKHSVTVEVNVAGDFSSIENLITVLVHVNPPPNEGRRSAQLMLNYSLYEKGLGLTNMGWLCSKSTVLSVEEKVMVAEAAIEAVKNYEV